MEAKVNREYRLGSYEGPLDLLLDLIKRSRIDIYDIPVAELTRQYIEYIETAGKDIPLEEIAEFYRMAAEMLYIKSRMLLPHEVEAETVFEDPRKDLVDRLIEYQKIKKYAQLLEECRQNEQFSAVRRPSLFSVPYSDKELFGGNGASDLADVFSLLIARAKPAGIVFNVYEGVTVRSKLALLSELLEKKESILFSELIAFPDSREHIVCAFMAVLEAARDRLVYILRKAGEDDFELVGIQKNGGEDER